MRHVPTLTLELLARYREIDELMGGSRASSEFRRWQASTAELLRKTLGFHPAVVEFQGLRFRAGPVHAASADEIAAFPAAEHDRRMRQDLAEAKRLLRRALVQLHVDVDAAPEAKPPGSSAVRDALSRVGSPEALAGSAAAERLERSLAESHPAWAEVQPALAVLLGMGWPVARAALETVSARLTDLR